MDKIKTKMPLFDKVFNFISPKRYLKRIVTNKAVSYFQGYGGGSSFGLNLSEPDLQGWDFGSGSSDQETLPELKKLRAMSRSLVRTSPIASGAINNIAQNSLRGGLKLRATPDENNLNLTKEGADDWSNKTEKLFRNWCESTTCDYYDNSKFKQLEYQVIYNVLLTGEVFVFLPINRRQNKNRLKVQLIEADRINTDFEFKTRRRLNKNILYGIEYDDKNREVAYYYQKERKNQIYNILNAYTRVSKYGRRTGRVQVLHIFRKDRVDQSRGIPIITQAIKPLKQLQRYTDAELLASVITACFNAFVTTDTPGITGAVPSIGENSVNQLDGAERSNHNKIGSGNISYLKPGEKVEIVDPKRPSSGFGQFIESVATQIGIHLQIPRDVLMQEFNSSYSASRAALLQAWQTYKDWQDLIVDKFHKPIYREWLRQAVFNEDIEAEGLIESPEYRNYWSGSEWIGKAQPSIDPLKETNAIKTAINLNLMSRSRGSQLLFGFNYKEELKKIASDEELARQYNVDLYNQEENKKQEVSK